MARTTQQPCKQSRESASDARVVAVIGNDVSPPTLDAPHREGVYRVRVKLEILGKSDPTRCGALLRRTARQMANRGWHILIYARSQVFGALNSDLG
ncbi:hypothetical protein QFZ97_008636 [Paraburkholderia youngii]